jgi:membrane-bound serine protease (ClpP class)
MCGAVLILVGLVGSAVSGDLASTETQEQIVRGGLIVMIGSMLGWGIAWLIMRQLNTAGLGHGFVLREAVGPNEGAVPAQTFLGARGVAVTDLRPSGRIEIDGNTVDAVCSGRWIEAGTPVRVSREGLVVQVEPYK